MKITAAREFSAVSVEIDENNVYIRYSRKTWTIQKNGSEEYVHDSKEIEALYQKMLSDNGAKEVNGKLKGNCIKCDIDNSKTSLLFSDGKLYCILCCN